MNIVFFGSAGFAVPSLEILVENGFKVKAVVTAPDRFGGRGKKTLISTPVKQFAEKKGIKVLQPKNLKSKVFNAKLKDLRPDLQVVVAFRMLPEIVWSLPKLGTFNLHGSLLPKYRGAAPINWAIINGEKETGCTTFFIDHKIDTGQLIDQVRTDIKEDETAGELHDRLMILGAELVLKTTEQIRDGRVELRIQNEEEVSHAPKIFRENCRLDPNKPVTEVFNFVRGMSPYPGAWIPFGKGEMKVIKARAHSSWYADAEPGSFLVTDKNIYLIAKDGVLEIEELKYSGKKMMSTREFLNGWNKKMM